MTPETLTLEAGERGEVVLYPERDVRDPRVVAEGTDDFAVEDVLLRDLPVPSVDVYCTRRGTWSAAIRGILCCPEHPLKVVVRNTSGSRITLRATIAEENK